MYKVFGIFSVKNPITSYYVQNPISYIYLIGLFFEYFCVFFIDMPYMNIFIALDIFNFGLTARPSH